MRSAVDFFPSRITLLTNFVTICDWKTGSGRTSRFGTRPRLLISLLSSTRSALGALGAVLRAALTTALDAHRVERAADDVIANAREILHAAAADEHDRVLLQVVADARDVGRDLDPVGEPHPRDLPQRRVRLLRRRGVDADADAAPLRAGLERGALRLAPVGEPAHAHELVDCRHVVDSFRDRGALRLAPRPGAAPRAGAPPARRTTACHRIGTYRPLAARRRSASRSSVRPPS